MNPKILLILLSCLLRQAGYGADSITQLTGARDWASAARMVANGSGVPIDSVIEFDGKEAWLYLRVPEQRPMLMYLDNPTIRNYEIISLETGETLYRGGLDAGLSSRLIFHPDFLLPMTGFFERDILLRVDALRGGYDLPIGFSTVSQVTQRIATRFLGDGMYYGAIVLMILFSFFVTLLNSYGHSWRLGICLLTWLFTMITVSGYGSLLIWPNSPEIGARAFNVFGPLAGFSSAWFAWHFLKESAKGSLSLKAVRFCFWLNPLTFLATISSVLDEGAILVSVIVTGVSIVCAASVSIGRGDMASRYLIVSTVFATTPFAIIGEFPDLKYFIVIPGTVSLMFVVVAVMKRLGERIQKQEVEAELVASRARFLASMSHEIRTPLNGVIGFSELCAQEPLGIAAADYVTQIQRSSKLLLNVVNEVLDFSKLEAGGVEISLRTMNLKNEIDNIVATLSPMILDNSVHLDVIIDDAVAPYVVTDPIRCSHILINLLSNAIKFSKNGHVALSVRQQVGQLEFEVKDTGIGIAEKSIQSLFDPYQQVTSSNVDAFGGTGLGLSIAKQFADLLGGTINVVSQVGTGSVFTLKIPYEEAASFEGDTVKDFEIPVKLNGIAVLVAEDNAVNLLLARKILEKSGATVASAVNGKMAMDLASACKYDVILMDLQMPTMNGIEASQLLRDMGCQTPIVALTANNSEADKNACMEAGMNDFIAKPFTQADLLDKVERWSAG